MPTLGRSRLVPRPGLSATVGLHYEASLVIGRVPPEYWVRRYLAGPGETHDERALRRTGLVSVRGAATDVPMHETPLRDSA